MWGWRRRPRRRRSVSKQYLAHKEAARVLVHGRLQVLNAHYNFSYGRVAVRNQRSRWGSCSEKRNLNFNYRLVFLPPHLVDYVIVHELCHLQEFNHGPAFWKLVEELVPMHHEARRELRSIRVR